ncbi:MAG: ABC transporter substrate-binding protein [Candidatus Sulfotelmatobacter sp.]
MCNKTEVAVGLSISLTGRFRLQGQQALQGIQLWQSYINAQGGIAVRDEEKRSVRLIWYDDRSQIRFARNNVFQLLREDQIDVLLGPYSSSLTMAVFCQNQGLWAASYSSKSLIFLACLH